MSCRVLISISFCSISVSLGEDAITLPPRGAPGGCLPDAGAITPICLPVAPGPLGCPWRRCWGYFSHIYAQSSSVPLFSSTSPFPVAILFTEVAAASTVPPGCLGQLAWPRELSVAGAGAGCGELLTWEQPGALPVWLKLPIPQKDFPKSLFMLCLLLSCSSALGMEGRCQCPAPLVSIPRNCSTDPGCGPMPSAGGISHHGTPPRAALRRGGGKSLREASGLCCEYIFTFCLTMRQPASHRSSAQVRSLHTGTVLPPGLLHQECAS